MTHLRQLPTLTLAAAKAIAAAAEAFAREREWTVAIAVVDAAGGLILFQILDDTQPGSQEVAVHKARTAARFKRPTKALEEAIAGGRQALLSLPGVTAVEGGLPIVVAGRVVGAVGVSGMQSSQDSQVAEAGLGAFRPD
jgi:glc operon protein GlcG